MMSVLFYALGLVPLNDSLTEVTKCMSCVMMQQKNHNSQIKKLKTTERHELIHDKYFGRKKVRKINRI